MKSLGWGSITGSLMPHWGITNLPSPWPARKSLPLMLLSGHTPLCHSDLRTGLQHSSISSTTLTANGNHLAKSLGLVINDNMNTKIIVDDIFSWAEILEMALLYMECQLGECQSYQLSLSLRKSHIFPKRFKFVGIYVCLDGNLPAMSKHQLIKHWPQPETVCDVAKIIGFAQFYSKFIPHFELQIAPLCKLTTKFEYTNAVAPHWSTTAQEAFNNVKKAILSDPCLKQ
jgi:hypothetical protein